MINQVADSKYNVMLNLFYLRKGIPTIWLQFCLDTSTYALSIMRPVKGSPYSLLTWAARSRTSIFCFLSLRIQYVATLNIIIEATAPIIPPIKRPCLSQTVSPYSFPMFETGVDALCLSDELKRPGTERSLLWMMFDLGFKVTVV